MCEYEIRKIECSDEQHAQAAALGLVDNGIKATPLGDAVIIKYCVLADTCGRNYAHALKIGQAFDNTYDDMGNLNLSNFDLNIFY